MEALTISIVVRLGEDEWVEHRTVPVPPTYVRQDIEPFVLHEIDKAVTDLQRRHWGRARSAEIIEQFDRRLIVIRHLIKTAPHRVRNALVARRVLEAIELDQTALFARYGRAEEAED